MYRGDGCGGDGGGGEKAEAGEVVMMVKMVVMVEEVVAMVVCVCAGKPEKWGTIHRQFKGMSAKTEIQL